MWACVSNEEVVHVIPCEDVVGHDLSAFECVCGPDIEIVLEGRENVHAGTLVTHHSLDGREQFE